MSFHGINYIKLCHLFSFLAGKAAIAICFLKGCQLAKAKILLPCNFVGASSDIILGFALILHSWSDMTDIKS